MNKWTELLFGLLLLNGAILVWAASMNWGDFWNFGNAAWEFLKGGAIWMVIMIGLVFIMLGISDLRE
jgi:hypothetical protein